jgi:hypothetical protein
VKAAKSARHARWSTAVPSSGPTVASIFPSESSRVSSASEIADNRETYSDVRASMTVARTFSTCPGAVATILCQPAPVRATFVAL